MTNTTHKSQCHFLRLYRRTDTRWAPILARAATDQAIGLHQNPIANFIKWTAESDSAWKVIVNKNCRVERRGLDTDIDCGSDVAAVAHEKCTRQMCECIGQPVQTVQPLRRRI